MQRIVPQLASASYCPAPPRLMLTAPRIAGYLTAPKTAGLLPSGATPARQSALDRQLAAWTAADAELDVFLTGAFQRLTALHDQLIQERQTWTSWQPVKEVYHA